ncbi:endoplasmic reticulum mannosyl-oligosaccharide 1,2-alpha-mannosidase [Paramyrothecium foliicola]|nr:endoplasmic reticulum mannosyl-oligosaccharide 1,2-alpha-mannosidase [Paramyrothecium foliicola]
MPAQVPGRLRSRYVALFIFACTILGLWSTFGRRDDTLIMADFKYKPSGYDWSSARVHHPLSNLKQLPVGSVQSFPAIQAKKKSSATSEDVAQARKNAIKAKFVKSWEAYKTYAWTRDELMPLTGKGRHSIGGWSAQIVDALDTLWIMGLNDEFRRAVQQVAVIDWSKSSTYPIDLFEVTIRYLGGLIGAYDLSQEPVLLAKAIELGDAIYAAFDTPNRLPTRWLDFSKAKKGNQIAEQDMSTAAGGTLCLEFTRLSQLTGDSKYYDATERVKQFFYTFQNQTKIPGLWPINVDYQHETMNGPVFGLGAGADSLYEYLPKMHALLGGLDPQYPQMTTQSLDAAKEHILFRPMTPDGDDILLAGNAMFDDDKIKTVPEMQHLTCFAGGMYGLAGKLFSRKDYVELGSRLTAGCIWAYDAFPTNIMPEISRLVPCENRTGPCPYTLNLAKPTPPAGVRVLPHGFVRVRDPRYLLRPEAIESVFYMWRITGDQVWRDAAWRMWEGIVRETETGLAFAAIEDVTMHQSNKIDSMETFWLSETLKYFYLIFEDPSVISLDDWVLNTEAHPFKRPKQHDGELWVKG